MNFDFSTIMVIAVAITGVIWAVDIKLWKPKRKAEADALAESYNGADKAEVIEAAYKEPILVEYARSFFPVILIVLILRSFLFEPFRIPSGSMIPTLKVGDFILVNKFTYGIRLPAIDTKIINIGEPSRGDVAVFRYPQDPSIDYIKRIIGIPGDKITYSGKNVYVNGDRLPQTMVGVYTETKEGLPIPGASRLTETIGSSQHEILIDSTKRGFSKEAVWQVPDGHYFVMGDNRDNSNDSRFWGTVPEENLVGKAFMIWMNWNFDDGGVEWGRIGNTIQ